MHTQAHMHSHGSIKYEDVLCCVFVFVIVLVFVFVLVCLCVCVFVLVFVFVFVYIAWSTYCMSLLCFSLQTLRASRPHSNLCCLAQLPAFEWHRQKAGNPSLKTESDSAGNRD